MSYSFKFNKIFFVKAARGNMSDLEGDMAADTNGKRFFEIWIYRKTVGPLPKLRISYQKAKTLYTKKFYKAVSCMRSIITISKIAGGSRKSFTTTIEVGTNLIDLPRILWTIAW